MDGLKRKKQPGKGPQNEKSTVNCRQTRNNHHSKQPGMGPQNPRTKKADPQRVEKSGKSGLTAGKKSIANCRRTEGSQPSVKQTGNNHQSDRDPQTQITQQDGRDARQSSTEAPTVQTMLKDRKLSSRSSSRKPSRSLSPRRGRLDSEDRGDSSITVQ